MLLNGPVSLAIATQNPGSPSSRGSFKNLSYTLATLAASLGSERFLISHLYSCPYECTLLTISSVKSHDTPFPYVSRARQTIICRQACHPIPS